MMYVEDLRRKPGLGANSMREESFEPMANEYNTSSIEALARTPIAAYRSRKVFAFLITCRSVQVQTAQSHPRIFG